MLKRDLYYERIPTKSLRDDVRYLGNILGRVIKNQEGQKFFDLVEKIRLLSKANIANKNHRDPFKKILKEVKKLSPNSLFKLTRAFNHFMNFYNLAESIDASRTLDLYENVKQDKKFQNIFIEEIFENFFKNKKISNNKIYNIAKSLNIGIVLTAHPTEVKRRTLIQKYHSLTEILEQRDLLEPKPTIYVCETKGKEAHYFTLLPKKNIALVSSSSNSIGKQRLVIHKSSSNGTYLTTLDKKNHFVLLNKDFLLTGVLKLIYHEYINPKLH